MMPILNGSGPIIGYNATSGTTFVPVDICLSSATATPTPDGIVSGDSKDLRNPVFGVDVHMAAHAGAHIAGYGGCRSDLLAAYIRPALLSRKRWRSSTNVTAQGEYRTEMPLACLLALEQGSSMLFSAKFPSVVNSAW